MGSKEIITQSGGFENERLFEQDGSPLYPFPDMNKYKGYSGDSGKIGIGYRNFIATRLGKQPGVDTNDEGHAAQPWKYVLGSNNMDLFVDGADGSPADNQKNLTMCCGYKYLLTANSKPGRPQGVNQRDYLNGPDDATGLFVNSQATMTAVKKEMAWGIGSTYGCHEYTKARWCCPVGIQFNWTNENSGSTNIEGAGDLNQHRYSKFFFLFQEKEHYKLQYAPLIWDYKYQNLGSKTGSDLTAERKGSSHNGFVRMFLSNTDINYLKSHRCALVGMGGRGTYYDASGTERWHTEAFWNVKFLFDTVEHPNSRIVWQEPTPMFDYLEGETIKLN